MKEHQQYQALAEAHAYELEEPVEDHLDDSRGDAEIALFELPLVLADEYVEVQEDDVPTRVAAGM